MQPRSRIRGRDPPPPPSGGRYRRRSPPPPPSPRHHRRARDPPLSQPQRRSPERPRRQEEKPPPDVIGGGAAERRSRADILLEAGRLAAHYLVAQGVLPEHLLRAREEPKHSPSSRPEPPAAAGYVRKRDDTYRDDDPRWRRNNGGAADWGRDKEDVDRLSRRSGWDRRSQSFDGRRKYNDGGGGDIDRGDRRSHEYDEQRRAGMRRSYSHNDRRASSDGRGDRRRRSRSRSRTRTRSNYYSSRRDSDWRAGGGGLDHSKVPDPGTVRGGDGDVDYGDIDQVPRDLKAPRSVVVMEANDGTGHEDAEMESEVIGLDHGQDVCGDEDGDNAFAGFNDADIGEINVTQHLLSNVDAVHPSDSVEEPVHMQSQLSDVEGDMEAGIARRDACLMEPVAENNGFSGVRDEMEAPQSEVETDVGDLTRDEQELPAWYGIFDFNVVRTQESCEMSDISGDPPADHVCDSVPDLVGRMGQRANYHTSETQGQGEHAHDDDHQLEDGQVLLNQGIGTHELNKYDLNNVQRLLNQRADENAQDNRPLKNEQMHLNHGVAVHDLDNCHLNDEEILLKQDADEQEDHNGQMENEQMLLNQSTAVQVLDNYHMNGEHLLLNHGADEHPDNNRRMENEQVLLHHVTGVHDLDNYDLNSEQILQNNGTDKPAAGSGQLKDEQMLLDQAADGQATLHSLGIRRMIPVINLEDDYEEQSDTREFLESKSDTLHKHMDNVLPEHMCSQDQQTSSFPDHPQANIPAAASSSVTPNFVNRWTGRGAVNAQGIPSDDDVLYVAFDKMPLASTSWAQALHGHMIHANDI